MEKEKLVNEIISTCKYFKIFKSQYNENEVRNKISKNLDDISFVENILSVFYNKMKIKKYRKNLNQKKLKKILIELEIIRMNLEFKGEYKC